MGAFEDRIKAFQRKTQERASQVVRKIALQIHKEIIEISPWDTGRFRANNQVSINSLPADATLEVDKSGRVTIRKGQESIGSYNLGDTIFIYNNVPYAFVIEFGRNDGKPGSKQAPEGVFRVSFQRVIAHLKNVTVGKL